jgi:hypothetical protein
MSRRAMRATVLLMLHTQQFGVLPTAPVVVEEPLPQLEPVVPVAWYWSAWRWLVDRYNLVDWQLDDYDR